MRPILLNSCARASTAAEARYRIDRPIAPSRGVRVLALDSAALAVVARVERLPWTSARFFTGAAPGRLRPIDSGLALPSPDRSGNGSGSGSGSGTASSTSTALLAKPESNGDGAGTPLAAVLDGADAVVMVATTSDGAELVAAVGDACYEHGIMTAGLVLGGGVAGAAGGDRQAAVAILRPYVRVILVTDDAADVAEILTALRA